MSIELSVHAPVYFSPAIMPMVPGIKGNFDAFGIKADLFVSINFTSLIPQLRTVSTSSSGVPYSCFHRKRTAMATRKGMSTANPRTIKPEQPACKQAALKPSSHNSASLLSVVSYCCLPSPRTRFCGLIVINGQRRESMECDRRLCYGRRGS